MKFTWTIPTRKGLREQAERRASRVRLTREIKDIQEEIDIQMQEVGEIIYAAHRGRPSDSGEIQRILEYVDGLYEELAAHREELSSDPR